MHERVEGIENMPTFRIALYSFWSLFTHACSIEVPNKSNIIAVSVYVMHLLCKKSLGVSDFRV